MSTSAALRVLLLCGTALALPGCARHFEAQRLAAPGGEVDAVLVASELAGDLDYDLRMVPHGAPAGAGAVALHLEGVAHTRGAPGVRISWLEPGLLLVRFQDARASSLAQPPPVVAGHALRIDLQQGPLD